MKNGIFIKVLIAMILAIAAGIITGPTMEIFGVPFVKIYSLIGKLFLNALNLVVVPLVVSSIISGTARMGADGTLGTLGAKTLGFFLLTTALAILVGMSLALIIQPGLNQIGSMNELSSITNMSHDRGSAFDKIEQVFYKLIPSNIFATAAEGQMLGLIFFSILFGYFISKIDAASASVVLSFWKGVFQIMMNITHLVMKALPYGVFGLVAKVVATTGFDSVLSLAYFSATVLLGFIIFVFVVLSLLLRFVGKVNPLKHMQAMGPALLTAFSTSSSAATLPILIECVEKRVNISNRICSFTVPLGTSLNLTGTTLHICVAVLFIAQAYGADLSIPTLLVIALMALFASLGIAGIPSAGLVTVLLILHTLGIPADAVGLILAVERILDMCRTVVNVYSNSCCAVLVARSEGENEILTPQLAVP